uniref:Uncharacterized protein n=1 Tax=Knipowitschia caucasica TaxID=637954 RepID=A0AAV2IY51_KNICA
MGRWGRAGATLITCLGCLCSCTCPPHLMVPLHLERPSRSAIKALEPTAERGASLYLLPAAPVSAEDWVVASGEMDVRPDAYYTLGAAQKAGQGTSSIICLHSPLICPEQIIRL